MSHDTIVAHRQVEITNTLGLHFRPAQKFVELASRFQSDIRVRFNGNEVNGKGFLSLMMMAAECGHAWTWRHAGPTRMRQSRRWPAWSPPGSMRTRTASRPRANRVRSRLDEHPRPSLRRSTRRAASVATASQMAGAGW